jgi:hypothetical protein
VTIDLLSYIWPVPAILIAAALGWLVFAIFAWRNSRRWPEPRRDSPYASPGYRGGLRVVRRSIADAVERAP